MYNIYLKTFKFMNLTYLSCPPLNRSQTTPSPKQNLKINKRLTELERLMQEQSNMINFQQNTIKEQEDVITCQKNVIGQLSEEKRGDSDYETYTTYSDTDDNHSPTRRPSHSRLSMRPHMKRTISCSTISNYHLADSVQCLEEDGNEM